MTEEKKDETVYERIRREARERQQQREEREKRFQDLIAEGGTKQ